MSSYLFLVPVSLALSVLGLLAFLWSLRRDQYDDLDGAAERVLFDEDRPIVDQQVSRKGARDGVGVGASQVSRPTDRSSAMSDTPVDEATSGSRRSAHGA